MKTRTSLIAAMMAAGILGAGAQQAQAAAVAQSFLNITDFTITVSPAPATAPTFNNTIDASADYNFAAATPVFAPIPGGNSVTAAIGPGPAAPAPGTQYLTLVGDSNQARGYADIAGGVDTPAGASSLVDTTVILADPADGSGQANSGVTANALFTVATGTTLTFDLTAEGFLRADLDQPQTFAQTDMSWVLSILDTGTNTEVFNWAPTEINESRSLNNTVGDLRYEFGPIGLSNFVILGPGDYQLNIRHETNADARWAAVPEPASLSLLGLGLLGLGAIKRRRQTA